MDHLFIVRIWSEGREPESAFRATVEHVGTRLRRHFAEPAGLMAYLEARVGEASSEPPAVSGGAVERSGELTS